MARILGDGTTRPLLYRYRLIDQTGDGFDVSNFGIRGSAGFSSIQSPYKGIRIELDQISGASTASSINIRLVLTNESTDQLQGIGSYGGYWITGGDASYNGGVGTQRIYDNTASVGHMLSWNTSGPISGWVEILFNWSGISMSAASVSSTSYYFDADCQNSMVGSSRAVGSDNYNFLSHIAIYSNANQIGIDGDGNIRIIGIRA
jgi:hypothetical protein